MGPPWLAIPVMLTAYFAGIWAVFRLPAWSGFPRRLHGRRPPAAPPPPRPLELIASDARRLGRRFHDPPPGTSQVKVVALQHAYDRVLVEGCQALAVVHLLGVLPPGEERDAERARVETRLWLAGLRIDGAA